jgi:hypothetical protein
MSTIQESHIESHTAPEEDTTLKIISNDISRDDEKIESFSRFGKLGSLTPDHWARRSKTPQNEY